ncbi:MAG: DUF4215 domain-containing protein [Deltaproteobacteria bacterium]|nr:DUF4215 domain-containing protein [Deltaproteobacteria bacterium]
MCGDGVVEGDETCDDGINDGSYGGCLSDCSALADRCGDGVQQAQLEACDDGDDLDGNGCNVDCVVSGSLLWSIDFDLGDETNDQATGVVALPDDSFTVVGYAQASPAASIRRFSPEGEVSWTLPLDYGYPRPQSIAYSALDEGFSVAGYSVPSDAWVVGATLNGNPTWEDEYPADSFTFDVAALANGGFVAVGGHVDLTWARRYGSQGELDWSVELPEPSILTSVIGHPDGGFIIAGISDATNSLWMRRYSESNQTLWTRDLAGYETPGELAVADNGSLYISGTNWSDGELWVLSLTAEGIEVWARSYAPPGGGSTASARGTAAAVGGGVFVVGQQYDVAQPAPSDILVRRYSAVGDLDWQQVVTSPYGSDGFQLANDAAVDSVGNLIVVGALTTDDGGNPWVGKFAP